MLVAINPEYHRKSYLRATSMEPLAKSGDHRRAMITTEVTLEHRGEATGGAIGGYTA